MKCLWCQDVEMNRKTGLAAAFPFSRDDSCPVCGFIIHVRPDTVLMRPPVNGMIIDGRLQEIMLGWLICGKRYRTGKYDEA